MLEKKDDFKPFKGNFIGKFALIQIKDNDFEGKIIKETKNTIQIQTTHSKKTIIKKNAIIMIDGKKLKGSKLTKRTEDRIKAR